MEITDFQSLGNLVMIAATVLCFILGVMAGQQR